MPKENKTPNWKVHMYSPDRKNESVAELTRCPKFGVSWMGLLRAELTGCPFRPWAAWAQESPGGERSWVGRHRGLGGEEVCGRRPGRQRPGQQRPWAGTGPPQLWACAAREAAEVCLVGGTPQGACSSAPQPPLASLGPRILLAQSLCLQTPPLLPS